MQDDSRSHGQEAGRHSTADASGQPKQYARGLKTAANAFEGVRSVDGSQISSKHQVKRMSGSLPLLQ